MVASTAWIAAAAGRHGAPAQRAAAGDTIPAGSIPGPGTTGRWGETFGDDVVAAAMIDRLVHHAEVIAIKDDSYRLKDRDLGRVPAAPQPTTDINTTMQGGQFSDAAKGGEITRTYGGGSAGAL